MVGVGSGGVSVKYQVSSGVMRQVWGDSIQEIPCPRENRQPCKHPGVFGIPNGTYYHDLHHSSHLSDGLGDGIAGRIVTLAFFLVDFEPDREPPSFQALLLATPANVRRSGSTSDTGRRSLASMAFLTGSITGPFS